ncbi:site-specific integrase [Microvirga sp. 17 mud 1-3]|uniref:site-specific integrase n=1 Tax=Microvirga sp. 17 mud 1-3 TaxID=2082949 RepID=UPI000D6B629D|nr:site-specific integrase [Microvirga sp. 17 mud 1-3]AWM88274.1 hypothetical protein C4E04_17005 [Microvirga sp. 17 mud 1-3]
MSGELMPKDAYLYRRGKGGNYYLNMRVPTDIVAAYGGDKVFVSLGTRNRDEARRQRNLRLAELEAHFDELRRTGKAKLSLQDKLSRQAFSRVSQTELERMAVGYFKDVFEPIAVDRPTEEIDRGELIDEWTDALSRLQDRDKEQWAESVQGAADHILMQAGWPKKFEKAGVIQRVLPTVDVDRTSDQYREFTRLVRRAAIEGSRLALCELNGQPFIPQDPLFAPGSRPTAQDQHGPRLSEALASWRSGSGARGSKRPRELTAKEAETAVRQFIELHGDLHIGEMTKRRVKEYSDALVRIPARLPTKLAKLTVPELLKQDLSVYPPRTAGTINKSFQLLSAIIEAAKKESDLEEAAGWPNYFPSVKIASDSTAEEGRLPFSSDELRMIFVNGPVHGSGKRFRGGQGEAQFWLPLLALFTGARLAELAQLRVCDIHVDRSGLAYLDIATSGGRTVKTRTSIRKLPIHSELRRLGFLEYIEGVRVASSNENRDLWPEVQSAKGRARSAAFSQWFNGYLRSKAVGIQDPRKVFHSFRHLFKDMCRDAGLSEDVHDALTGHGAGSSVGRRYGAGHSVARLATELNKVVAPVDLSHLPREPRG